MPYNANMQVSITPTPDSEVAAAVAAAILCYLDAQAAVAPIEADRAAWRAAAALEAQRLPPARNAAHAAWSSAERASRENRWSYGIVGI